MSSGLGLLGVAHLSSPICCVCIRLTVNDELVYPKKAHNAGKPIHRSGKRMSPLLHSSSPEA